MRLNRFLMGIVLLSSGFAFGQGSLTPPGAPAPTMKTLDQVEPRTPISMAGYSINSSGSYYLTADLVPVGGATGIIISSDDVTLDLNGFSILGVGANGQGISMNDRDNVVVRNGTIRDCYYFGIAAFRTARCRFENLRVIGNGRISSSYDGIRGGTNITITGCTVMGNGSGIEVDAESRITGNQIVDNTNDGLHLNGVGNYIADNIIKGSGDNYDLAAGNQLNLLLCDIPESLDWPCSVKLAGTLECTSTGVNGITVEANNVTIDLGGHTLIGPGASSGSGIWQYETYHSLRVFNGKVINWQGAGKSGILAGNESILSNLQVEDNNSGIRTPSGSIISSCTVRGNANTGIGTEYNCIINQCTANDNSGTGISAYSGSTLSDCIVANNGSRGILMNFGGTVSGCTARRNGGSGIFAYSGITISDCLVSSNNGDGIEVDNNSRVEDCTCDSNGQNDGAGIHLSGSDNRIDGNSVISNKRGVDVDSTGNLIVRNSAAGNGIDYDIVASNEVGTIQTTPVGAGAWDNFEF